MFTTEHPVSINVNITHRLTFESSMSIGQSMANLILRNQDVTENPDIRFTY